MKRLVPERTAVLLVDLQERLLPVIDQRERLVKDTVQLLEGAKLLELPVFTTEQYPRGLGATVKELQPYVDTDRLYEKKSYSFAVPPLLEALTAAQVETVVVCGAETHICVFQGIRDLLNAGFQVVVPFSCVGSRTEENKANALMLIARMGADIANVETVLFDLLATADHPQFKAVSRLIK